MLARSWCACSPNSILYQLPAARARARAMCNAPGSTQHVRESCVLPAPQTRIPTQYTRTRHQSQRHRSSRAHIRTSSHCLPPSSRGSSTAAYLAQYCDGMCLVGGIGLLCGTRTHTHTRTRAQAHVVTRSVQGRTKRAFRAAQRPHARTRARVRTHASPHMRAHAPRSQRRR